MVKVLRSISTVFQFNFNSLSARLPCYLLKGPLKRGFLNIYLTTFSADRKCKNTSAVRVILFFKCLKLNENGEMFFFSEINASDKIAINCLL